MAKGAFTNADRIRIPLALLAEQWPEIAEQIRKGHLDTLRALKEQGLSVGPEAWNELIVETSAATIRLEYDDKWTSYVGVVSSAGMDVEVGLVVGPVDVGFRWGRETVSEEKLSSVTRIHMEAILGTATPRLTEAVMAELTRGSDVDLADVAVKVAEALAGVGIQPPT